MASRSSFTASSSASPSIPQKSYDVFLSFRGEDTRYNFTDHLYSALDKRGIRTFRDDKLNRGEAIAPELLKAIEESRSSVIVFSENYAHSRWCLDELVKIMECKKDLGHTVFPIFYHVDPSHVRHQTGSFGVAFAGYEENWKNKIQRWRTALTEAANLSGWHLLDGYESNLIKEMTDVIFRRLNCKRLDVGANLVGINYRIQKIILRLHMESSDVRIVGIYGIGGIGKTTIAKVLYNKLSCEFEYMSFLKNIREVSNTQGLPHLQNQLLGDILEGEGFQNNINSVDHGASMIKSILSSKRVFVVLDDVDDLDQLEYLLRNREWLGKGSRVIITTRNKHLLDVQEVDDLYKVEGLYFQEACRLFSLYAFKQNLPKSDFINLSKRVVYYCRGLPLALKVLGSYLCKKTISEWESELHKLAREPEAKIHNVLKRSYDGLDRTEKNIFLDVACFFKDEDRDFVSRILDGCNFHAKRGIKNLNDKCLLTVPYNQIRMHDLIQQMGREIVREKFPNEPHKWSRLWDPYDIERAFRTYEGIKRVETISLDFSRLERVRFNSNVFAKMTRLRLLKVHSGFYKYHDYEDIEEEKHYDVVMKNVSKMQFSPNFKFPSYELRYLCWDGYPLDFLPSNFDGENLIELHLKYSSIKQLWQGKKDLERLKVIDLSYSKNLIQMPEFSSMSNLERLILRVCVNLIDVHPSVGILKKFTTLNLRRCDKLKGLPSSISSLESLEILNLSQCSSFEKFPEIQGSMRSLRHLFLRGTAIRELPSSISNLESLEILDLSECSSVEKFPEIQGSMRSLRHLFLRGTAIRELPSSISNLESLEILDLSECSSVEKFPEIQGSMRSLRHLFLRGTAIRELPSSISNLESLEILDLSECSSVEKFPEIQGSMRSLRHLFLRGTAIRELPSSISNLESLEILDLSECSSVEKFPEIQGSMRSLRHLFLRGTAIREIPSSIDLESVEMLDLGNCSKFEKFPENGANMKSLCELDLENTAIKELPAGIANWESLPILDLSCCFQFEKFPEKGGNMKILRHLHLWNTAIKDLPDSIGDLKHLEFLDLSHCSKFEKFPEKGGNMKSLRQLRLRNTAIKDLPDSIGDLESLHMLDLFNCLKFEKFPEKGGNMKSLRELYLNYTAIKDLPDSIGDLESLMYLDLSHCSKFEKFPEKGGNMKSLRELRLRNTAIKDLPDSIGNLKSVTILDLSECSKFEKFPEKGGNMKSLRELRLRNTAIKDLPDSIGNLKSVTILDLSECSKFEKFPEKGWNMKSLRELRLRNTAIKDLPDSVGDMEYVVEILDLSYCSKFEKFPELMRSMKHLRQLNLRGTAIEELPSVDNLSGLRWLDIGKCKNLRNLLDNIYKFKCLQISAYNGRNKDDTSLLWLCHLKWLESATDELKCWKLGVVIPESNGIPEWVRHQNLGNEVTTEFPMNWYEDPDFLGFVVSCVYQRSPPIYDDDDSDFGDDYDFDDDDNDDYYVTGCVNCQLNLHGNGFEFKDALWSEWHGNLNDFKNQVHVWWYPKIAIPKKHHNKVTHFNASFWHNRDIPGGGDVKKCGVNLIFAGGQHKHVPMLLDLPKNFDDNGSVVLEESNGNRKRSRDDSYPHTVEEPQYKRLGAASNTNLSL